MKPPATETASLNKVRLADIAREADVSIGTVSRVLNGKTDVDPALSERVHSVARRLGYTKRGNHRGATGDQSTTAMFGYLMDNASLVDVRGDAFYQQFLHGIENGVNNLNGHLLIATCTEEIARGELPAMVAEKRVQGVILKGTQTTPDAWLHRLAAHIPTVMLMGSCEDRSIHSVICDNHAGAYQIMRYLHDMGHRRIAFLTVEDKGMPHNSLHLDRLDAYHTYVQLLGCTAHEAYVQIPVRNNKTDTLDETVERGLQALLDLGPQGPTAIICANDIYAIALLNVAARRGISVPADLSVAGFMNIEMCEHSSPPLTSVHLTGEEVGRVAVNLLREHIETPGMPSRHVSVGTRLIERLSCCPPRQ